MGTVIVIAIVAVVASLSHPASVQFVCPGWMVVVVDADRLERLLAEEPQHDGATFHFFSSCSSQLDTVKANGLTLLVVCSGRVRVCAG